MTRLQRLGVLFLGLLAVVGAVHFGAHLATGADESCDLCFSPARLDLPPVDGLAHWPAPVLEEWVPAAEPDLRGRKQAPRFGRAPPVV